MVKSLGTWVSLLSFSAVLAQAGCAAEDLTEPAAVDTTPIIGGQPVQVGQFPAVVAVRLTVRQGNQTGPALCTGSLIAKNWVLTAAHCVSPAVAGQPDQAAVTAGMKVSLDTANGWTGGREIAVAATIPNPGFNNPGDPDLGLIKLAEPITDRAFAKLNFDHEKALPGMMIKTVGYGVSNPASPFSAGPLNQVDKGSATCSKWSIDDTRFVCVDQTNGSGSCEGDSGGPSFSMIGGQLRQVAVTSFGEQSCGTFGAFMRVDAGRAFLLANVPELFCVSDGVCDESCGSAGLPADPDCQPCMHTSDCDSMHVCQGGFCVPGPASPGGAGAPCTSGTECDSGTCGAGPGGMKCTETCNPSSSMCADGFDCLPTGPNAGACWPGEEAVNHGNDNGGCGCSVGGQSRGAGAGAGGFVVLLVGAVLTRRRRRRA